MTPRRGKKSMFSIFIESINLNLVYRNAIKDLVNIFKTLNLFFSSDLNI